MLPFPDYIFPALFVFDGGIFERMSGMRLIDVNEITDGEIVKYLGKEYWFCVPDVRDLLNDQPTAFDVEKVLEQLEKSRGYIATTQYCNDMNGYSTCGVRSCFRCCLDYLIGIVKRGGIDETN